MSLVVRGAIGAARGLYRARSYTRAGRIIRAGLRAGALADAVGHARKFVSGKKRPRKTLKSYFNSKPPGGGGGKTYSNKSIRLANTIGKNGGYFRKPRKLSSYSDPYQTKGFVNTAEINGTVSDPDCIYAGTTAVNTRAAVEVIAQAMLRKLFEKCAGITVTNVREPLQGYHNSSPPFSNADGFRISLVTLEVSTGQLTEVTYETLTTDSIFSIVGNNAAAITPTFNALMLQLYSFAERRTAGAAQTQIPIRLQLFRRDGNVTNFYVGSGSLDLRNEYVHLKGTANMKLQNRSVGAGGSTDANAVNCNPLQGYLYEFKGGVPQFKDVQAANGALRLNRMFDQQGVVLARGAGFDVAAGKIYREPPVPKMWSNCVSSSRIKLAPSEIKRTNVSWSYSCKFMEMLEKLRLSTDGVLLSGQTVNTPGKCVMFALEDMINVNASELIAVAYEVNRTLGAYLTTGRAKMASGEFTQLTLNENA
uniref:Uncharacterized protein n=1 Tax=Polar freshwater circular DNA virus TaxID=2749196 RepID=A0A7D7F7Q7_9VIRU|nr:MAG: hypothetical protein [Polar freshwater circular DNA virus]